MLSEAYICKGSSSPGELFEVDARGELLNMLLYRRRFASAIAVTYE